MDWGFQFPWRADESNTPFGDGAVTALQNESQYRLKPLTQMIKQARCARIAPLQNIVVLGLGREQQGMRGMNKIDKSIKAAGKAVKPALHAKPAAKSTAAKPIPLKAAPAAADDAPVIALNLPMAKLTPAMNSYFKKCQEKLGFVPNVLVAYAFDTTKLETFVALYNDLMLGESGLSKLEREMIAVAVSSQNRCYYCLTAHGAAVRQYSRNPLLGEQIVMNYRVARLNKRQRAMLDFAVKLTASPWSVEENDRERLRRAGFTDRNIWDISAVAGFFNMSNRVASATDMRPNTAYHAQAR
jgi:uncharacterized peroxidase-related enzyme